MPSNPLDQHATYDPFAWGGRANDTRLANDGTGALTQRVGMAGTSGADQDVDRYRGLSSIYGTQAAPGIDRSMSDQSRGQQTDAMGLMRNAAYGGAPSRAEIYGQKMLDDSIDTSMGVAASARGGPLAQAAAMNQAQNAAAQQRASGMRDLSALRADEMARARGDYYGAASGMRSQDIANENYATDNEFRQRQLNQGDRQFYEQQAWNTRKQQQDAALQKEQIGNQAWYQGRQATMQDEENAWGHVKDVANGVGGFIGGIFSDERAKMNIYPVSGGGAALGALASGSVGAPAEDMRARNAFSPQPEGARQTYTPSNSEAAGIHFGVMANTPSASAARVGASMTGHGGEGTPSMQAAPPSIGGRIIGGFTRGLRGFGGGAMRSPAAGPADQYAEGTPDSIRGVADGFRAFGSNRRVYSDMNTKMPVAGAAPATFDALTPGGGMNVLGSLKAHSDFATRFARHPVAGPTMMSDERSKYIVSDANAKREAFELGAAYADAQHAGVQMKAPEWAVSKREEAPKAAVVQPQPSTEQTIINHPATQAIAKGIGLTLGGPMFMGAVEGAHQGIQYAQARADGGPVDAGKPYLVGERGPELVVPQQGGYVISAEQTPYVIDLDEGSDRSVMRDGPSDPRARSMLNTFRRDTRADQKRMKRAVEDKAGRDADEMMAGHTASLKRGASVEDPMASANRAQAGSLYTYRPEFTPDNQTYGEVNVGPMAQTMASDPIASTAVKQDPNSGMLMLDSDKLDKVQSSGIASLQRQIDELEARLRLGRRGGR